MYEPLPSPRQSHSQNKSKTLPGPRPSLSAASTVAPAEISCSTTAAWPSRAAQCSAFMPRAPRMRRGRWGQQRLPSRNKAIVMGCFSGLLGKIIGRKYQIRQADTFVCFSVRHCEAWRKTRGAIIANMFLLYGDVQILQAVAPDFASIKCRLFRNYFMNTFGLT